MPVATLRLSVFLLALGFSGRLAATETPPSDNPSADEIVARAVERFEAQHQDLISSRFEARVYSTERSLGADGEASSTEILVYDQYPLQGALYDELILKNDLPLTEKEKRAEAKRRAKFLEEVRKRRARGEHPQPDEGPGIRFNHELMGRYRTELAGVETVRGRLCWVIDFEPRDGKLPTRNRMDPALNKSTGRLWVSQDDYGLARLTFAMREPFKYWGGLLATIRSAEGELNFDRVAPDAWLPLGFDFRLDLEVLMVKNIRRHITRQWSDYRPADLTGSPRLPEAN